MINVTLRKIYIICKMDDLIIIEFCTNKVAKYTMHKYYLSHAHAYHHIKRLAVTNLMSDMEYDKIGEENIGGRIVGISIIAPHTLFADILLF